MGTKAYVLIRKSDITGKEKDCDLYCRIYNHYDGYPEGLGEALKYHLKSLDDVKAFIAKVKEVKGYINGWNEQGFEFGLMTEREIQDFEKGVSIYKAFDDALCDYGGYMDYIYLFKDGKWLILGEK